MRADETKQNTKPVESTTKSTEQPLKGSPTPQDQLEAKLWRQKMDRLFQKAFSNGADLSGKETR